MANDSLNARDDAAETKAGQQASLLIDFDLEDIIAGNVPASASGQALLRLVAGAQDWPTQGKIEAELIPLYEALAAAAYASQGGTAEPPLANRHSIQEHAKKVLQARKVLRAATARAARPDSRPARSTAALTQLQLAAIGLLAAIAAVAYLRLR